MNALVEWFSGLDWWWQIIAVQFALGILVSSLESFGGTDYEDEDEDEEREEAER